MSGSWGAGRPTCHQSACAERKRGRRECEEPWTGGNLSKQRMEGQERARGDRAAQDFATPRDDRAGRDAHGEERDEDPLAQGGPISAAERELHQEHEAHDGRRTCEDANRANGRSSDVRCETSAHARSVGRDVVREARAVRSLSHPASGDRKAGRGIRPGANLCSGQRLSRFGTNLATSRRNERRRKTARCAGCDSACS